jgi:hypothetical protein
LFLEELRRLLGRRLLRSFLLLLLAPRASVLLLLAPRASVLLRPVGVHWAEVCFDQELKERL